MEPDNTDYYEASSWGYDDIQSSPPVVFVNEFGFESNSNNNSAVQNQPQPQPAPELTRKRSPSYALDYSTVPACKKMCHEKDMTLQSDEEIVRYFNNGDETSTLEMNVTTTPKLIGFDSPEYYKDPKLTPNTTTHSEVNFWRNDKEKQAIFQRLPALLNKVLDIIEREVIFMNLQKSAKMSFAETSSTKEGFPF